MSSSNLLNKVQQLPWLRLNIVFIFCLALYLRVVALDHIPGVSGDEAFYGKNVIALLKGDSVITHTPNGNVLNPFYTGILFLLQLFLPYNFWVLRLPALLTNLALIPLTFFLTKKLFDRETAFIATVLTAVLPINIAQSRMGWDPSQTTLISLLTVYLALTQRWGWCFLSLVAAFFIHPTNIFLFPLVATYPFLSLVLKFWRQNRLKTTFFILFVIILSGVGCFFFLANLPHVHNSYLPYPAILWERALAPMDFIGFLFNYAALFSGTPVYCFFAGLIYPASTPLIDKITYFFLILLLGYGLLKFIQKKDSREFSLLTGLLVTLPFFYLLGGNVSQRPGAERYSLFLIIPTTILIARFLQLFAFERQRKRLVYAGLFIISWFFLASFTQNYFFYILKTGGNSGQTFHTGPQEPKQLCLKLIVEDAKGSPAIIYPSPWWNFNPMYYLGNHYSNLTFQQIGNLPEAFKEGKKNKLRYVVVFSEEDQTWGIRKKYRKNIRKIWVIKDFAGRPLEFVYKLSLPLR